MLTLLTEFYRQRQKFDLIHPIDIGSLENQIKSTFGIDDPNNNEYLIQIYDSEVDDYLDLTSESFISTNNITSTKFFSIYTKSNKRTSCWSDYFRIN